MVASGVLVVRASSPRLPEEGVVESGYDQPVALLPVLNRSLVVAAVEDLIELGAERVVVLVDQAIAEPVAAEVERITSDPARVGVIERADDLALFTAVSRARRRLPPGPFALQFADCLSRRPLRPQLLGAETLGDHDAIALMTRYWGPGNRALIAPQTDGPSRPDEHFAGFFIVGEGFPLVRGEGIDRRTMRELGSALDEMERNGGRIERRYVTDWWRYNGQADPVLEANRFLLDGIDGELCTVDAVGSELDGPLRCDASVRIEESVIRGPVIIGPGAKISHSFIGPYSSIGAGVEVTGVEIENSVVLEHSSLSHIGGRIDSSVIGPRARVFRDFKMPRGTRMHVGPGANICLQ